MEIQEAISLAVDKEQGDRKIVADKLGVSYAMIGVYLKGDNKPRLEVAAKIYGEYGFIVEPFSETAIKKEWENETL